jgi:hypothetical protein
VTVTLLPRQYLRAASTFPSQPADYRVIHRIKLRSILRNTKTVACK